MDKPKESHKQPPKMPKGNDEGGKVVDRDIMKMKDGGECCIPTDAEPIRLHAKMAGAC